MAGCKYACYSTTWMEQWWWCTTVTRKEQKTSFATRAIRLLRNACRHPGLGDATRRTASSLNKPNFRLDPITPLTGVTSTTIWYSSRRASCNSFYIFTCYLERGKSKSGASTSHSISFFPFLFFQPFACAIADLIWRTFSSNECI